MLTREQFPEKGHGKTAPWVDLVNSEEWDTFGFRTDHLENPDWTPYFLEQWRFKTPRGEPFPIEQLRGLRTTLRKSCEAIASGRPLSLYERGALNGAMNAPCTRRLIERQNGRR